MAYLPILSLILTIAGIIGTITLLASTVITFRLYWGSAMGSFRWHLRNLRLRQLSALACLFFLAMTASYAVLHQTWAILYFIIAFKTGTWWFRLFINERG